MPDTQRPSNPVRAHRDAVDAACHRYHLGGVTVWRTVKSVSVLLTVAFGFWSAVEGSLAPSVAFAGMVLVIIGAEGLENLLAAVGENGLNVSIDPGGEATDRRHRESPEDESDES